jgi:hypothetical protein
MKGRARRSEEVGPALQIITKRRDLLTEAFARGYIDKSLTSEKGR